MNYLMIEYNPSDLPDDAQLLKRLLVHQQAIVRLQIATLVEQEKLMTEMSAATNLRIRRLERALCPAN